MLFFLYNLSCVVLLLTACSLLCLGGDTSLLPCGAKKLHQIIYQVIYLITFVKARSISVSFGTCILQFQ